MKNKRLLVSCLHRSIWNGARKDNGTMPFENAKVYEDIPAVPGGGVPFLGNFMKIGQKPHGMKRNALNIEKFQKRYDTSGEGLLRMRSPMLNPTGDGRILLLFKPEMVQQALGNEGSYPYRGEGLEPLKTWRRSRKDLFPDTLGMTMEDFEPWKKVRSAVQQDMMRLKSAIYYLNDLQGVAEDFVKLCRKKRDSNGTMPDDHLEDYFNYAIESITVITLNERPGGLTGIQDERQAQMLRSLRNVFTVLPKVMLAPPMYKISPYLQPAYMEMFGDLDIVGDYFKEKIDIAILKIHSNPTEEAAANDGSDDDNRSILEKLILKCGPDSSIPFVTAFDMLMAGIDTTGHAIAFLLYCLSSNPEAQETLRAEISQLDYDLTEKSIGQMRYLRACLKESQRLYPLVSMFVRICPDNFVMNGYQIPSQTMMMWIPELLSKQSFSEPEKFRPERWLRDSKAEDGVHHAFASTPFGFGPRACVGRRFAELEVQIIICKMIQNFKIEWAGEKPLGLEWALLNGVDGPVKLKLTDAR